MSTFGLARVCLSTGCRRMFCRLCTYATAPAQDLYHLQKDRYAQLMQSWLAGAVRLDAVTVNQLGAFCAVDQPPDTDPRDMLVLYKDNEHFSNLALQLPPMMWDISYGVRAPWKLE